MQILHSIIDHVLCSNYQVTFNILRYIQEIKREEKDISLSAALRDRIALPSGIVSMGYLDEKEQPSLSLPLNRMQSDSLITCDYRTYNLTADGKELLKIMRRWNNLSLWRKVLKFPILPRLIKKLLFSQLPHLTTFSGG